MTVKATMRGWRLWRVDGAALTPPLRDGLPLGDDGVAHANHFANHFGGRFLTCNCGVHFTSDPAALLAFAPRVMDPGDTYALTVGVATEVAPDFAFLLGADCPPGQPFPPLEPPTVWRARQYRVRAILITADDDALAHRYPSIPVLRGAWTLTNLLDLEKREDPIT